MILALGARGPGLNSQNSPILIASSIVTIVLSQHSVHGGTRVGSVQFAYISEARLAQSAERKALNLVVVGSSPTVGVLSAPLARRCDKALAKLARDPCLHLFFRLHQCSSGRIHHCHRCDQGWIPR